MGKASRWLRSLIAFRKPQQPQLPTDSTPPEDKSHWTFTKSSSKHKHKLNHHHHSFNEQTDPGKHAMAVAAATAAVAEAAVAAARSRRCDSSYYGAAGCGGYRKRWGAVVIQSAYRGYLARRALKALKALVKLQAIVRGHIARKQTAAQVRRMQALLRVQARACAGRIIVSESSQSSTKSAHYHPCPATPEKSEDIRSRSLRRSQPSLKKNTSLSERRHTTDQVRPQRGSNWNNRATDERVWDPLITTSPFDDMNSDKILEVDLGKPYHSSKGENHQFHSSHHIMASDIRSHSLTTSKDSTTHQVAPSSSSCEAISLTPIKFSFELEDASYCTAGNSPRFYSASSVGYGSSRGDSFKPSKSDSFHTYLSGYSGHPNYMANTESSKAKLRSLSAPRQRLQQERSSFTKKHSYHAVNESKSGGQRLSSTSKGYLGSGRLDKLGKPVTGDYSYTSL